ncbi:MULTISPECIES: ABC transporter ATP-binding protein [unclassified Crossiella]|uniref:ABC transporter ATP-binding protein n=1 Tax=unclassified Crossiella TaxID=2620835 RepID=UPI001FFF6638|nr:MULTISPECIES: ABC transporter ATP-binding protein [unclassified Crossiella]MCK2240643.1 ABC transporter ATP-binding protein [Crossiella sp. S99.2]MCK2252906.1 ABC transporter ATP-binding protein [Crossiella sp. S99.1]
MSDPLVRTHHLTKRFGALTAVEDLDLELAPGEILGFLGPNGAGKTTTIRMLLGLARPTAGRASVLGHDAWSQAPQAHHELGFLPAEFALHPRLTGLANLDHLRALRQLAPGPHQARAHELAERLDVELHRPLRTLSSGNKRKIGIIAALAHSPRLAVLDEPISGLDPLVQKEFHTIIDELRATGAGILLSSHTLPEVERVADRVAIMRAGRLVACARTDVLLGRALHRFEVTFAEHADAVAFTDQTRSLPSVFHVDSAGAEVRFAVEGPVTEVVSILGAYRVLALRTPETELEDVFLRYYGPAAEVTR